MKSRHGGKIEVKHSAPIPIPKSEEVVHQDNNNSFYVGSPRSEHIGLYKFGSSFKKVNDFTNLITPEEFERRRAVIANHLFKAGPRPQFFSQEQSAQKSDNEDTDSPSLVCKRGL